jgi:hypothetical protein
MQDRNGGHCPILHPVSCIPRARVFRDMHREFCRGPGLSFRYPVPGTRCRVPATWHRVPDTRYRIRAEGRTPSPEDRAGKRAHWVRILHLVSCILHPLDRALWFV